MSVTSSYVNYLIWRYLQESGKALTALALDKETEVSNLDLELGDTAKGELVRLLLKGVQMCEVEKEELAVSLEAEDEKPLTPLKSLSGATCIALGDELALGATRHVFLGEQKLDSDSQVTCLSWSSAKTLAAGSFSGQLRVWNPQGTLLRVLNLHRAPLLLLKWNRGSTHLLSVDINGIVGVWEGSALVSQTQIPGILAAAWIDTRTLAVSAGRDIAVYKLDLAQPHTQFHGHAAAVSCLTFDYSTQLLASGADDGTINIWHGRSMSPIRTLSGSSAVIKLEWLSSPFATATAAEGKITSKLLAGYYNGVALWDVDQSSQVWKLEVQNLLFMAFKDDFLAVAGDRLEVYRISTLPELIGVYSPKQQITGLAWNNSELVLPTKDETLRFTIP